MSGPHATFPLPHRVVVLMDRSLQPHASLHASPNDTSGRSACCSALSAALKHMLGSQGSRPAFTTRCRRNEPREAERTPLKEKANRPGLLAGASAVTANMLGYQKSQFTPIVLPLSALSAMRLETGELALALSTAWPEGAETLEFRLVPAGWR